MTMLEISGVRIEAICAALPTRTEANDEKIARATGILARRIAEPGETVVDLCVRAAKRALAAVQTAPDDLGAVVFVSFTQHDRMPCAAAQAQARLGIPNGVIAFDVSLACSGWGYGLYLAGLLARQTGRKVLLLDGDVQSEFCDAADGATVPLLADGGTATLIGLAAPSAEPWRFSFVSDGEKGDALRLEHGGTIRMDGFGVFRFVATDVVRYIRGFVEEMAAAEDVDTPSLQERIDWFVPHQPNAYMVRQLAKSVGFDERRTAMSCDRFGNMSSASVPVAMAVNGVRGKVLFAGFGGGLSVSIGAIQIDSDCRLMV